jgi:tungstate transport system substrate-binding protein
MALLAAGCEGVGDDRASSRVLLATTTSTANTGLLDELLPAFEKETGVRVDYLAVGTGAALKHGENGDVDILIVHAPAAEDEFVRRGHGVARIPFMYNDFVILGPPSDPAPVDGSGSASEALSRIDRSGASFVSRGDDSGTHKKERVLWSEAGLTPAGSWYLEAGQGMGACLLLANEKNAYVLTDRGTYLSRADRLEIRVLHEGDPALMNPYAVIAVSPERRRGGNHEGAQRLVRWLTSADAQRRIEQFRVNGHQLFHPGATGVTES